MSYEDPVSQRKMALDGVRNGYYERALEAVITQDSVVLDAGAGIGVLGLTAASMGAKKVYLAEPQTNLEAARKIAQDNDLENKIQFIPERVERANLSEPVDVIMSVFTGNFLLEEDLLASLFHARDAFLKPGGVLIPGQASMLVMPVSLPEYYAENIGIWSESKRRIDHSSMRTFAVNSVYYDRFSSDSSSSDGYSRNVFQSLAASQVIHELDFYTADEASCDSTVTITVESAGQLHGFIGWFDIAFGDEWLSTSPDAEPTHWSQAFLPVDPVIEVKAGQILTFRLKRPQNGEWHWSCMTDGLTATHSTFLSQPFSVDQIHRKSAAYQPQLSSLGEVARSLLLQFDGSRTVGELIAQLLNDYPWHFSTESEARSFIADLAGTYGEK
jgi:predicted RNA methylase